MSHWSWDRIALCRSHFQMHFICMEILLFQFNFHWIKFLRVRITINQYWCQEMTWHRASHYLNQRWSSLATHICLNRTRWSIILKWNIRMLIYKSLNQMHGSDWHSINNGFMMKTESPYLSRSLGIFHVTGHLVIMSVILSNVTFQCYIGGTAVNPIRWM